MNIVITGVELLDIVIAGLLGTVFGLGCVALIFLGLWVIDKTVKYVYRHEAVSAAIIGTFLVLGVGFLVQYG